MRRAPAGTTRRAAWVAVAIAAALPPLSRAARPADPPGPPNVLVIVADDQSWSNLTAA